jgi:hypothetical protein
MSAAQALLHISAICFVGAIFLNAVNWFEPNRWVAITFKCAILAAGALSVLITKEPSDHEPGRQATAAASAPSDAPNLPPRVSRRPGRTRIGRADAD